jgi:ABC-type amino acid transport substrate-binding protein
MSSLSITEKRQQEIAFTDKLYAADSRLVVKKGSDITPDLAKLKGKRVGVLQGTTRKPTATSTGRRKVLKLSPIRDRTISIPT